MDKNSIAMREKMKGVYGVEPKLTKLVKKLRKEVKDLGSDGDLLLLANNEVGYDVIRVYGIPDEYSLLREKVRDFKNSLKPGSSHFRRKYYW